MFGLGIWEILLVLLVALLVLGPKRLPDAARSLGRALGEFRRASSDLRNAISLDEPPPQPNIEEPAASETEEPVEEPAVTDPEPNE